MVTALAGQTGGIPVTELILGAISAVAIVIAALGPIIIKLLFENRAQHGSGLAATKGLKDIVIATATELRAGQAAIRTEILEDRKTANARHQEWLADKASILERLDLRQAPREP